MALAAPHARYAGQERTVGIMSVSQRKVLSWNWSYVLRDDRLEIELAGRDPDDGTFLFGTREGRPSVLYRLADVSEYEAARYMLEMPSSDADLSTAEALLLDVIGIDPDHAAAHLMLAHVKIERGDCDDAQRHLQKAAAARSDLSAADESMLDDLQPCVDEERGGD